MTDLTDKMLEDLEELAERWDGVVSTDDVERALGNAAKDLRAILKGDNS